MRAGLNRRHNTGAASVKSPTTRSVEKSHLRDEVDGNTLAPESSGTAYTVDVVLAVGGQVVVDDQRHLQAKKHESSGTGLSDRR